MKISDIISYGITLVAFLIVYEKYVIVTWRYVPTDPFHLEKINLASSFTELLTHDGKLAATGWSINHPSVVNNQNDWSLTQRDIHFLQIQAGNK